MMDRKDVNAMIRRELNHVDVSTKPDTDMGSKGVPTPPDPYGVTHEMTHECALTTVDNPYDPFIEYDAWHAWDERMGYHSPSLLARFLITNFGTSEANLRQDEERAIDTIVRENWYGMHRKLMRPLAA